jgi:glyoxylase-like metal-dependent hydrolase (beta-lactamase superfamily II)
MRELQPGVWHWSSAHPEWSAVQHWPQDVSSYAIDDGERLLLFDPLAVPDELLELAAERAPAIVLTAPWHERDTKRLADQLGAPRLHAARRHGRRPRAQVRDRSRADPRRLAQLRPRVADRRRRRRRAPVPRRRQAPVGVEAFPGRSHNDLVLWIEGKRALAAGDSLADFGRGFEIPEEVVHHGVTREQVAADMRPLLELPVELVLPAHGEPVGRDALERALA